MCFGDGTSSKLRIHEQSQYSGSHTRYGPHRTYYPPHYYARAPVGPYIGGHQHHALHHKHRGRFGHRHHHHHAYMHHPRDAIVPARIAHGGYQYHGGGRALMPSATSMRSFYGTNPVMAAAPGAYTYSYPGVGATTVIPPSTTTYTTVTNSAVPVPVATTTSTTTIRPEPHAHAYVHSPPHSHSRIHVHSPPPHPVTRDDVQYENRRVAMERGSYNPRRIKPADARPDDPFWCMERTGEWHLRTYYQIENECYPGRWLMDAEHGFLVFHRE